MSHRPGLRHLTVLLLATLVAASANAESHGSDLPASREMEIDEPVFQGKAWVVEAGRGHERSVVLVHGLRNAILAAECRCFGSIRLLRRIAPSSLLTSCLSWIATRRF